MLAAKNKGRDRSGRDKSCPYGRDKFGPYEGGHFWDIKCIP
jgi:hypothetical protein